ncbi:bifunctional diaminohydroxyphosphoribosylaminopyrimidine deaminase/5-amino-6-(5-phosphoribosylamino)uracil reductase RibD [Bordetella genomosp. 13]|uniref:Riboflavin biosynthesis protein RibD n=1 Tax=Bordetella genomosp. 13 TaxID=463040 RepID=A0A1W6ZK03_9BORD|nr:bifunctional diaminohydroxyphosphoribosylaminopyrimidine deaminase/5-amino-6-(5-phosphoribosylamino)uracil reductase RibD [Bordetella genomosp. 13]ARP97577.1 riboflavin biosynthesis protein RibD [Bordetella genomosp. 13]
MRRALALARGVLYTTTPNPRVGCVIVRDGQVLGEGATQPPGGPHAEIRALRDATERGHSVEGATLYVTLEPCSHHGRTPPCVDAVLAARPARVVVAMGDPNPQVNGRGLAQLRAAGIAVDVGVCVDEALELNPGFVARMQRGTPWTWLKLAASLDGRSALHNGMSQWITGPEARADGHHWRARSCVVLTGMGTVLADDPQLNVREVTTTRPPRKAVVDARYAIPENARLLDGSEVLVFTARSDPAKAERLARRNVQTILMPGDQPQRVDLDGMMRWFGEHDVNEVHVEAGAGLSGALLSAGCVDELLVYLAPMLLGDAAGMVRMPMIDHLDGAQRFEFTDFTRVGADARLRARVAARWQALRQGLDGAPR